MIIIIIKKFIIILSKKFDIRQVRPFTQNEEYSTKPFLTKSEKINAHHHASHRALVSISTRLIALFAEIRILNSPLTTETCAGDTISSNFGEERITFFLLDLNNIISNGLLDRHPNFRDQCNQYYLDIETSVFS